MSFQHHRHLICPLARAGPLVDPGAEVIGEYTWWVARSRGLLDRDGRSKVAQAGEVLLTAEVEHDRANIGDDEISEVVGRRTVCGGAANEVARGIDEPAPEPPALPEAFVCGVGAKDDHQAEHHAHPGMGLVIELRHIGPPEPRHEFERQRQSGYPEHAADDRRPHRPAEGQDKAPPVFRIVVDHLIPAGGRLMEPITITYPFRPRSRSLAGNRVADLFGLSGDEPPHVVADKVVLDVGPGDVGLFTGPSGSGKSSLLRAAAQQHDALDAQALQLPDVPLIDALNGELDKRLDLLSACGLSEARLLLRTPKELSDG